jgi:uroporphyrinogen-III decarboxylase
VDDLFDFATRLAMEFAAAQVDAGVDIVGVGDAAASLVGPDIYEEVVWPHEKRLVDHVHGLGARVRLHICGNMSRSVAAMARLGADIVDLDSLVPLDAARAAAGPDQVLAGNLNPVTELMSSTPGAIARLLAERHAQGGSRWVVAAGCEIPAATPPENVDALVAYARSTRP